MHLIHLTTVHSRNDVRICLKQLTSLAKALPYSVSLVVADGKSDSHGEIPVYDLGATSGSRAGRLLLGSLRAFLFIRKLKPKLVHFHDPELIPLGMLLKLLGCKIIYDVHEDVPRQILSKRWIPWYLRRPVAFIVSTVEWFAARIVDAVIPATPKIAERFPRSKTVVVQNFPIRSELILPNPQPYASRPQSFAYIGGIAKIRGAVEMVNTLQCLREVPDVRLLVAGGFDPANLETELRALPAWDLVEYKGFLNRSGVASLLGSVRAGLVVFHNCPNHFNAQPNKLFEYMAAGLPVIASDFPLWRQIVNGAACGLLVDPSKPQAIADAMRWILDHPAEAEAMGQRGRKAVEDAYNWECESEKLIELYRKLLQQREDTQ